MKLFTSQVLHVVIAKTDWLVLLWGHLLQDLSLFNLSILSSSLDTLMLWRSHLKGVAGCKNLLIWVCCQKWVNQLWKVSYWKVVIIRITAGWVFSKCCQFNLVQLPKSFWNLCKWFLNKLIKKWQHRDMNFPWKLKFVK